MSVFPESTHLFPCYMCQTGILAEFLLRHLHSGMGERSLEYKKKKKCCRYWRVDLKVTIFVSISGTGNHQQIHESSISVYSTFGEST